MLEGSLLRGEERLAKLASATNTTTTTTTIAGEQGHDDGDSRETPTGEESFSSVLSAEPEVGGLPPPPPPQTRDEGRARWEAFLRDRFIRGGDEDFDYSRVEGDDELDVLKLEEREEAWFDEEDPAWVGDDDEDDEEEENDDEDDKIDFDMERNGLNEVRGGGGTGTRTVERVLKGETGVQDF